MIVRMLGPLFLIMAAFAPASAAGQAIGAEDRAAIEARVAAFDRVMSAGRVGDTLDFVPQRLLDAMARNAGVEPEAVRAAFAEEVGKLAHLLKFVSFDMDVGSATSAVTPDGSRGYMLIPTETVIEMPGAGRVRSVTSTLAMKDGDQWYLVRIEDAEQIVILRKVYPEFTGVEFPAGSITAVE